MRDIVNRHIVRDDIVESVSPHGTDRDGTPPDLEAYLPRLKHLDRLRKESRQLTDSACVALNAWMSSERYKSAVPYENAVAARLRWQMSKTRSSDDRRPLEEVAANINLQDIAEQDCPVIVAAQVMRALISHNALALSSQSICCWYWIVRELFSTDAPDWRIGGARAGEGGWVTAYSTHQCIEAVLELAASLEATGRFFREVDLIEEKLTHLDDESIPEKWRDVDRERLGTSCSMSLELLSRRMAIGIHLPPPVQPAQFLDYLRKPQFLLRLTKQAMRQTLRNIRLAIRDVHRFRNGQLRELVAARKASTQGTQSGARVSAAASIMNQDRAESAHKIALNALMEAEKRAADALKAAEARQWKRLAGDFDEAAKSIRTILEPSRAYVSGVIDRQLASSEPRSLQQWDLPELVFATLAHCRMGSRAAAEDTRVEQALDRIFDHIGADGSMPAGSPYHSTRDGYGHLVTSSIVLAGVAELTRQSGYTLNHEMASHLLPSLKERHFGHIPTDRGLDGWYTEFDRTRRNTDLFETASAVEALDATTRMLDEGINRIILEHFNVRDVSSAPPLDHLFYADYGFASEDVGRAAKKVYRESVAITLQKMRAHVCGCRDRKTLRSLVLHGPPGTGKTTLVESLARSCGVQLVEVTPSDLAKRGEVAIEQRARAVFYALSLLTRVVILFDEFDPVLRSRDTEVKGPLNILAFLTPGMLPKLKELSERAKELGTAYVLITNLIGTLDNAAVRTGRFDQHVGVYPPDPLSRLGYFQMLCGRQLRKRRESDEARWHRATLDSDRLAEFVVRTVGMGMTPLMGKGWYRWERTFQANTPMGYVFGLCRSIDNLAFDPEARFEERVIGSGPSAQNEYFQWGWLNAWERRAPLPSQTRLARKVRAWCLDWPESRKAREVVTQMQSGLRTGDNRLVIALLGDEFLLRWKRKGTGLYDRMLFRFAKSKTASQVRRDCATPLLSRQDLYVFEHCAERALEKPLFQDDSVSSQVVYVSVLTKDFIRRQATLCRLARASGNDGKLLAAWRGLETLAREIDEAIARLFVHFYTQYRAYLESSTFWKQRAEDSLADKIVQSALDKRTKYLDART